MEMRPPLLLTRPRDASARFARQFAAQFGADWPVVIAPLQEIVPLCSDLGGDYDAVVLTSAAGAQVLAPGRGRDAWCVGQATANAARAKGFCARCFDGGEKKGGDGLALARAMVKAGAKGRMLYPHGRHRSVDLARLLPETVRLCSVVAYEQRALPIAPDVCAGLCAGQGPILAPVFSRRSGLLLAQAVSGAQGGALAGMKRPLWVAAISDAAGEPLAALSSSGHAPDTGVPAMRLAIAPRPDAAGVLVALASLLTAEIEGKLEQSPVRRVEG